MSMRKCEKGQQANLSRNLEETCEKRGRKKQFKFNRQKTIKKERQRVTDMYEIQKKIGSGSFGEVYLVHHKQLKVARALKVIKKTQKTSCTQVENQLNILKQLDHPTVLKIYQYFETDRQWQIITEYFEGKQLFDLILTQKGLTQQKAAMIFAQVCRALAYIHNHQIVHRDIKPQNILVRRQADNTYRVKLIDWGLGSKTVQELIKKCGTPQYCAPQVIKGSYGYECDLWSLGVLLYVMLIGRFPFKGKTAGETLSLVLKGQVNFQSQHFKNISTDAKVLISKLLKKDPKLRITAQQCLSSSWITNNINKNNQEQEQTKLMETLERIKTVNFDNKFQAIVVNIINNYFQSSDQQDQLRKQFLALDQNKDGVISLQEMKKAYQKVYSPLQAQRIAQQIFTKIDLDGSNKIQYSQFVAFGRQINNQFSTEQLRQAFRQFDEDQDGTIDKKQLNTFLSYERLTQSFEFDRMIKDFDTNNDGRIDIEEFMQNIQNVIQKAIQNQTKNSNGSSKLKELDFRLQLAKKSSISTISNMGFKQQKQ